MIKVKKLLIYLKETIYIEHIIAIIYFKVI